MRHGYHPEAVWEEADGCVFATAATVGEVAVLEGVAAFIWQILDGATLNRIAADVSAATDTDEAHILPHLTEFLADLERRKLVLTRGD